MSRIFLLLAVFAGGSLFAADAPAGCKPIKSGRSGEIALVQSPVAGTWNDVPYNKRALTPHLSVCVDSEIRLDGRPNGKEQLILRDEFGNNLPPFTCAKLLNCQ